MTHQVAIDEIAVGRDAVERLAVHGRERRWRRALLVMDVNTEEAAGWRVARGLRDAGVRVEALRFANRTGLAADEHAVSAVRGRLRGDDFDAVVAVGSGVITDVTRYGTHLEDREFVSVPTAASMDGYASSVAAMEVGGVKLTFPARAPRAIFADPGVLASAPVELTRAGLGDLLGKATARTDWLASHLLFAERFCPAADGRVLAALVFASEHFDEVLRREPNAIERLLHGLIESGIAMAMTGGSRPASGCEHHASHLWDLLASRGVRPHAAHGLQVGYATRFAMRLQRFAFAGGVPALEQPQARDPLDRDARELLGGPPPEVIAAIEEKRRFVAARAADWPRDGARWAAIRAKLAPALQPFEAVDRALAAATIPAEPGFLDLDARTLRATFRYASRLRARYTVIDFLEGQGMLEEALDAVLGAATSGPGRAGG